MIDAHHHLWRYNAQQYGWIDDTMGKLRRDFLAPDLAGVMRSAGVSGSVAVQARQSIEETDWLLDIAGNVPQVLGVVGWLPLQDADFRDLLVTYQRNGLLKGLRHVIQDEPEDDFPLNVAFNHGVAALSSSGLSFDLLVRASQLPATNTFVRQHPEQKFVLDHLAKPSIRDGRDLGYWRAELMRLGECSNVMCKLSGLATEADWETWGLNDLRPFLDIALAAFGPERLMAGSDWPVCLLACEYDRWWSVLEEWCAPLAPVDRNRILAGNAAGFYGLSPRAGQN